MGSDDISLACPTLKIQLTKSQREERQLAVFVENMIHSSKTINDRLKPLEDISQLRGLHFDTESPRFKQAQHSLGILDEELEVKKRDEFETPTFDQKICLVRYNHHRTTLM